MLFAVTVSVAPAPALNSTQANEGLVRSSPMKTPALSLKRVYVRHSTLLEDGHHSLTTVVNTDRCRMTLGMVLGQLLMIGCCTTTARYKTLVCSCILFTTLDRTPLRHDGRKPRRCSSISSDATRPKRTFRSYEAKCGHTGTCHRRLQ